MNPIIKKILAVLLAGVMLLSLAACKSKPADTSGEQGGTEAPVAAATDRDAIAAKVGDLTITVGELEDAYDYEVSMFSYYQMPVPTADADIESLQDSLMSSLVNQKMLLYQAKQQGYDALSAEQEAELTETISTQAEEIISMYSQDAEVEGSDPDAVRDAAIEMINNELAAGGWDTDFEGYCAILEEQAREGYIISNLETAVKATATIADEDVRAYYDTLHAEQQMTLEDPTKYIAAQKEYEMNGGKPMLIVPEGVVRVKALTIMPEGTMDEGYDTLLTEMAELEAEYGHLSLSGEAAETRLEEIRTTYAAKKLESDKMFEAYTAPAKAKANEAYQKLQAGEDFNAVFAAYNEDESYMNYEAFADRGMPMMPGQDDGAWDDALRAAAAALTPGQYSGIVEVEDSYYIVYLVEAETPGDVAYEAVYEPMHKLALEQRQAAVWDEQRKLWAEDDSIVTYFEDAYRSIGK